MVIDQRLPYAVRSVLNRWRGMLGMILGVGLALGIGMTLLAVSQASLDLFTGDYTASGTDLYVISSGGKLVAYLPGDSPGTIKNAGARLAEIRGFPGVQQVLGVLTWPLKRERPGAREHNAPTELVMTVGVDGDPSLVPGAIVMRRGRWMRRADEIVLGQKLSREKDLDLGQTIRLSGRDFTIVGIGRLRGVSYSGDSFAFIERNSLRQRADIGDIVNTIQVDTSSLAITRERIRELGAFSLYDRDDVVREVHAANDSAIVLRWIIVILTLGIAALFVANMLSSSVQARRLEFGTLTAIGIPARTISWVVAGEALLVCCAAALVVTLFSLGMGKLINQTLATQYGLDSLYVADARLFLTMLGLTVILGVAAGVAPARQAASVDPIDVLREA